MISGDTIGLSQNGTHALGNSQGVELLGGSVGNTIGGTTTAARDVISGNGGDGIYVTDAGTSGNVVEGDFIGTDPTGLHAIANNWGVFVTGGATNNTFGGTTTAARDLISGNAWTGLELNGTGTSRNVVEGDWIGTNATGNAALGNPARRRGDLTRGQLQYGHRQCDFRQRLAGSGSTPHPATWSPPISSAWARMAHRRGQYSGRRDPRWRHRQHDRRHDRRGP